MHEYKKTLFIIYSYIGKAILNAILIVDIVL